MNAPARENPLWIVRVLTENIPLKLVSLALACVLFSIVHSDVDAQRSLYVDLVTLLPPAPSNKMLVSELPHEIKLTLRGSRSRVSALSRDDLQPIQMDLTDTASAEYVFDPAALDLGAGLEVTEITPSRVPLVWVTSAERRIRVRVPVEGVPRAGYHARLPVEVRPEQILVRGPEDLVKSATVAETDPMTVDGLGPGTHTRWLSLRPLPSHVFYEGGETVEARVIIEPTLADRVLRGLDVSVVGEGELKVRPERVTVTLRGPEAELESLAVEEVVPYVDMTGVGGTGGGTQPQEVQLRGVPEGVQVERILPDSVLVTRRGR
jgi:YbbR domain-containing protein